MKGAERNVRILKYFNDSSLKERKLGSSLSVSTMMVMRMKQRRTSTAIEEAQITIAFIYPHIFSSFPAFFSYYRAHGFSPMNRKIIDTPEKMKSHLPAAVQL